ncbi:MAG: Rid family hydrolase [Candidatus Omnitrophica bacterium]|nr:Rid family hydrolase [Candidatus Omnitrophota bacterium]
MKKGRIKLNKIPVEVNYSCFKGSKGVEEYHFVFTPLKYENFQTQIKWLYTAYKKALKKFNIKEETSVFRRFFCSDLYNQKIYLEKMSFSNPSDFSNPTCISWICQPPESPARISMWAYHINDRLNKTLKKNTLIIKREKFTHYWTSGLINIEDEFISGQTKTIIKNYIDILNENNMTIFDNVIRTWYFIQNIDTNYKEFVSARREIYFRNGLTPETHFIASTGVEGAYYDPKAKVILDAYAISGIKKEQIKFLSAPEYLSPTYIYGVTFERGTSIDYSDRRHIIISGTASINNKGEILHSGNILLQLKRTLKNIKALLKNADADLKDMMIFIVYVRDPMDIKIVKKEMKKKFKNIPIIFAVAKVCRPGWLVEIEGIAVIDNFRNDFPDF